MALELGTLGLAVFFFFQTGPHYVSRIHHVDQAGLKHREIPLSLPPEIKGMHPPCQAPSAMGISAYRQGAQYCVL